MTPSGSDLPPFPLGPDHVAFGIGSLAMLGALTAPLGRVAVLVGARSASRSGLLQRCEDLLRDVGLQVRRYGSAISSDPTVEQVDALAAFVTSEQGDVVVAVGGGSVLDCAKAAAAIALEGGPAFDYVVGGRSVTNSIPLVAVPTTAGTGSELSRSAIITWVEGSVKGAIRGDALIPVVAVVDPELTVSLPPDQTGYTGFDAFAHAVETYLSRQATPETEGLSADAVVAITASLPRVLESADDISLRTTMARQAMLMGYNLAHSSTCLPHRLQYAIGARTDTAHGLGLAALFTAWVRVTAPASPERFATVTAWINEGLGSGAEGPVDAVTAFQEAIGLTPSLRQLGVEKAELGELVAATRGPLDNDPWWSESADVGVILSAALEGSSR